MRSLGLKTIAVAALAAAFASANAQVQLTGIVWYTTDSAKHYTGGFANTYGGDQYSRNLYVSENATPGAGTLLNSDNLTTLPTRVNPILTAGTYTFQMYCNDESTTLNPFWGMNLFFDGNDTQPGIAAWNVVNVAGFQSVNPTSTPTLDPLTMGLVQSGSGLTSLIHTASNGTKVTLTAYNTWSANHYNVDRVDNWSNMNGNGNGTKDNVIEFTLNVTPVPEPTSMVVFGAATLTLSLRKRLTRRRSSSR